MLTTTEREELLLAAKAAGLTLMPGLHPTKVFLDNGNAWRPREDDGDALRLSVACHIDIRHFMFRDRRMDCLVDRLGKGFAEDVSPGDPCAATRSAIFRAAVEIGKTI